MRVKNKELFNNSKVILAKKLKYHRIFLTNLEESRVNIHKHFEVIYLISGRVKIKTTMEERILLANQAYIISPDTAYRITPLTEDNILLCFQTYEIENYSQFKLDKDEVISNNFNQAVSDEIASILGNLYLFSLEEDREDTDINKQERVLLKKLGKIFLSLDKSMIEDCDMSDVQCLVIDIVEKLPNMIYKNEDLSLENLAKKYNISYSYLSRVFKEVVNRTYTDYLLELRLNKAVDLLINTNKKILDVAVSSGFYSIKTFNNTFKRVFKLSPTEFRKEYKRLGDFVKKSPLFLDDRSQYFFKKVYSENISDENKIKYIIDMEKEGDLVSPWANVVELDHFLNDFTNIHELHKTFKSLEIEFLIVSLRVYKSKLYLLKAGKNYIELKDSTLNHYISMMESNNIYPVVRFYVPDLEKDEENEDFFQVVEKKLKFVSSIVDKESLREYRFELYTQDIEKYYLKSSNIDKLGKKINEFRRLLVDTTSVFRPYWGIYLGAVDFSCFQKVEELFTRTRLPEFINIDIEIDEITENTTYGIISFLKELDCCFSTIFNNRPEILINIKYTMSAFTGDSEKDFFYSSLFLLDLLVRLERRNYILISCSTSHAGRSYRNHFFNQLGVKLTPYYVFLLIRGLENEVIYNKPGIIVTKAENEFSVFLYECYQEFLENTASVDLDMYKDIRRRILINLIGLEGNYKVTQYLIKGKLDFLEINPIDDGVITSITPDERMYLSKRFMPEVNVNFKDSRELRNYRIEKNPLDSLLIKFKRI